VVKYWDRGRVPVFAWILTVLMLQRINLQLVASQPLRTERGQSRCASIELQKRSRSLGRTE
jgi:hypothetical protein